MPVEDHDEDQNWELCPKAIISGGTTAKWRSLASRTSEVDAPRDKHFPTRALFERTPRRWTGLLQASLLGRHSVLNPHQTHEAEIKPQQLGGYMFLQQISCGIPPPSSKGESRVLGKMTSRRCHRTTIFQSTRSRQFNAWLAKHSHAQISNPSLSITLNPNKFCVLWLRDSSLSLCDDSNLWMLFLSFFLFSCSFFPFFLSFKLDRERSVTSSK